MRRAVTVSMSLLRRSLFLFVVVGSTYGGLVGTSECTYGPSYWCHSIQHAKQCNAVKHCIQSVWENQVLPADNDDICSICKDMVQQARDTLESNETQEEIKQVFDGSCQLIPLKEVAKECKQLAEEFIPELIETLASQMNPQVVCATAGLCNSVRVDRLLREQGMDTAVASDPTPTTCKDCQNFVDDTVDLVRQHSKQELMDHLLAICGELGSISDGCSALVATNIDTIYNFLSTQINPNQVCALFGMCGELFGKVTVPDIKNGDEACDFCVVIAQHWRDMLISNSTEEELVEVLEGICRQTGSFAKECLSLVDQYALNFYDFLLNNFDPKSVCEVVGICSDKFGTKPVWTVLHTGVLPAGTIDTNEEEGPVHRQPIGSFHLVGTDEANSYSEPNIKVTNAGQSGLVSGSDEACTMCEFTLHFIQIQLQDQHTREEIETAVKNVCQYLPKDVSEQCQDYVDAYGDQVIALLQQEIDPSVLCPYLGLCPKSSAVAPETPSKEVVTCVACEFIMKQIREILQDRRDEESIKNALDTVCSLLPNSIGSQCQTFVDENAIEVMQLLAAGVDPEQICRMLGLCHDGIGNLGPLHESNQLPMSRLFVPVSPNAGSDIESTGQSKVCVLCEFAMKALENLLLDNSTHVEADIQKGMDLVCLHLPTTLQEDCLAFVDQYTKAIIELLVSKATPQTLCRELTVCSPPKLSSLSVIAEQPPVNMERSCLICKAVATIKKHADDADQRLAQEELDLLCSSLLGGERALCLQLKTHNFDRSEQRSAQCTALGQCEQRPHLVGAEPCTWGPAYWCQSALHAKSCGATAHCEERVWIDSAPPS